MSISISIAVLFFLLLVVPERAVAFTIPFVNRMPPRSSSSTSLLAGTTADSALSIGFVGCGTISFAIATGLLTQSSVRIKSISVSRRSEGKSSALKKQYPDLIQVFDNNQYILDSSDVVFVCVLPQQTSDVLRALNFDASRHTVVSLVSTSTLSQLAKDTALPPSKINKCICLPAVARHEGVCLLTPKSDNQLLLPLFESLGGVMQAENEEQMSAMMVPSGLMGSMYGILKQSRDWLVTNGGVSKADSSYLVSKFFWGMLQDAERKCGTEDAFEELIAEQTPGGLNEQALKNLHSLGAMESLDMVQDALFDRIRGKSDGSLPPSLGSTNAAD